MLILKRSAWVVWGMLNTLAACHSDDSLQANSATRPDAARPGGPSPAPAGAGGSEAEPAQPSAGTVATDVGSAQDSARPAPDARQPDWDMDDAGPHADDADTPDEEPMPTAPSGSFLALTYNVAGLPEGLSSSMPQKFTPLIGPLLNDYDLVLLQESWQTPIPNPLAPLRGYHELLVAAADHAYKTPPATQPFLSDPRRPSALLGDGLNLFARYPLADTQREMWSSCVDSDSDCLALKGFSMTPMSLADGLLVHIYDLHMEAGDTPADDTARAAGIEQLIAFIAEHSKDEAAILAGDFNLHTDREPAATQLMHLLAAGGFSDACSELQCAQPGSIDKFLFRSSSRLQLTAKSWELETDVFVSADGQPLSDHDPIAVRFDWSARAE